MVVMNFARAIPLRFPSSSPFWMVVLKFFGSGKGVGNGSSCFLFDVIFCHTDTVDEHERSGFIFFGDGCN